MKKSLSLRIIITIVFALLLYYFMLPPMNLHAFSFYMYFILVALFYLFISIPDMFVNMSHMLVGKRRLGIDSRIKYILLPIFGIFILIIVVNFILSPLFNSKAYYNRIAINEKSDFSEDIDEVDFNHIPLLDKDSSEKLGDRTMGSMTELVSQFTVSNMYTQINYNNDIIRVTPLEYASFIKYFTNRGKGVPAYITVNSVTGKSALNRLDKGMKYVPSALFFENLYRKLRISYPTLIFGSESFEIDNEGNPYFIIPTIKYTGVGLRREVNGIVIFNPITGESERYDVKDIPTWVDHVYNADLIIEEVNDWGLYKNGFLNTLFGQKDVVMTTTGYSYTIMNDDVYLYTGITSVMTDESNIGFILTNMRTKETVFYRVSGAEEYSAMASAEGQVQQMKYTASFPLLINFKDRPTYLLSLKDDAGLVKMYAFVDVEDYQKVVVADASEGIIKASEKYLSNVKIVNSSSLIESEIIIVSIKEVVIDGNTYYYLKDDNGIKYKVSIKVNTNIIPFLNEGDKIKVSYDDVNELKEIVKLEK